MIYTQDEIDKLVRRTKGTWVKRRNLRRRLNSETNNSVMAEIDKLKKAIRLRKAEGAKEKDLRPLYAEISHFEFMLIEK